MSEIFDEQGIDVAIAGATGEVGRAMLSVLEQRHFPVRSLYPLGSSGKPGRTIAFRGREVPVGVVEEFDFSTAQLALFSMGGSLSLEHGPRAAEQGCLVIDNSSAFRQDDDIPLVVPEVNAEAVAELPARGIIANPNCSTIQLLLVLAPLQEAAGLAEVYVATYQAVSGAGRTAIEALERQAAAILADEEVADEAVIGFNAIPHIDTFQDNGFTREEMKIVWESRKILGLPELNIAATAVRVPVFHGHGEAVRIKTGKRLGAEAARELLADADGVEVVDERKPGGYPTARGHAAGADAVFVGRIRDDLEDPNALHLWVVADNVRKGAALNAVQIGELLLDRDLIERS